MRNEIKAVVIKLESIQEKVEEYLDNAQDAENPNEERVARLEEELNSIEEAIEALNNIE